MLTSLVKRLQPRRGDSAGQARLPLASRRILVAGASGAIGSALAAGVAAAGADVCLHYFSRSDRVVRLAARINAAGTPNRAHVLQADLQEREAARQLFDQACQRMQGVDVLINCVGMVRDDAAFMLTEQDVHTMLRGNLAPVVYLCEALRYGAYRPEQRRIINIASITGLVGQPMRALYGAAKGAVISYTKALAREVAPVGITANCIAPQVLDGGLASLMKAHVRKVIVDTTPVKRSCTPEDLVSPALFLASRQSGFVTGTVLNVTGGLVTW